MSDGEDAGCQLTVYDGCTQDVDIAEPSSDHSSSVERPSLRDQVLTLYRKGEATALLSLISGSTVPPEGEADDSSPWEPLLLWVRPRPCCLHALADQVKYAGLSSLASVGCGTGLLEWLIQALTGLSVIGYEVNADWWTSKYAPPTFIPLTFVDPEASPPYVPPTYALMCCYFNNGDVFRRYVAAYEGPLLMIIGPTGGSSYHTDPLPLDYEHVHPWTLSHTHHISQRDLLACYVRDQAKEEVHRRLRF